MKKVYQAIASAFTARQNCEKSNNTEWFGRHTEKIEELVKNHLPSGSGFDSGTTFDFDRSREDRLIFYTAFHHMDENGYYDGWSEPITVTVKPTFQGIDTRVTGIRRKNREEMQDYVEETFYNALTEEIRD